MLEWVITFIEGRVSRPFMRAAIVAIGLSLKCKWSEILLIPSHYPIILRKKHYVAVAS